MLQPCILIMKWKIQNFCPLITYYNLIMCRTLIHRHSMHFLDGLIFFGDEIQELYKDLSILNVNVVRQILAIGKSGCAVGIISGSSSNVRALARKEIQDKYLLFPNLNQSVYVERHLNPLRTENEIKQYLESQKETIDMDPFRLFQMTGGVGRHMDSVLFHELKT